MGIGDNGVGGDQPDCQKDAVVDGPSPKSPWKKSAAHSPAMDADSDTWPALSDAKQRQKIDDIVDSSSNKSPPPQQTEADDCAAPPAVPAPTKVEQQKMNGRNSFKNPRRPSAMHQNKTGPKQTPNGVPPFPVPLQYYAAPLSPVYHAMVPMSPIPPAGYAYPLSPGSFPRPDTQSGKSGNDNTAQDFIPLKDGGFRPFPHADSGAHDSNSVESSPRAKERGRLVNPSWNNQRPVASNSNFHLQQNMGPRPFFRPSFSGPSGFVDGPNFPGPPGVICYFPAAPPSFVRVPYPPYLVPYSPSFGVPMPPSPTIALKANIVRQIEYYFSDHNLQICRVLGSPQYLRALLERISCLVDLIGKRKGCVLEAMENYEDALAAFQLALKYNSQSSEVSRKIKRLKQLARDKKRAQEVENMRSNVDMAKHLDSVKSELAGKDCCDEIFAFLVETMETAVKSWHGTSTVPPRVYFLLDKEKTDTEKYAPAVNIDKAFESPHTHGSCFSFLRQYAEDSFAQAACLVAPKSIISYPQVWKGQGSRKWKHGQNDGFFFQFESPSLRKIWFVASSSEKGQTLCRDPVTLDISMHEIIPRLFK